MWSIFAPALITGDRGIELQRLNEIQAAELNRMVAAARPALLEIEAIARMDDDSQRDYAKPRNAGRGAGARRTLCFQLIPVRGIRIRQRAALPVLRPTIGFWTFGRPDCVKFFHINSPVRIHPARHNIAMSLPVLWSLRLRLESGQHETRSHAARFTALVRSWSSTIGSATEPRRRRTQ
jgi:hypothetical protein